jgi:general secretion pathway protein A
VSIRYELQPLTREEMAAYITHRLQVAGGSNAVSFTPRALHYVHQYTGGIPRLINLICDRALLGAFSARVNRVTHDLVERAAETLDLRPIARSRFAWLRRRTRFAAASRAHSSSVSYR